MYVIIKYVFVCIYSIFITSSCPLQNCNDTQTDKLNDILLLEKIDGFLMFIQKEGKYQKTLLKWVLKVNNKKKTMIKMLSLWNYL